MKTQKQTTHRHLCCLLFAAATLLASTLHATPLAYSGGTATAALSAGQWAYYEVTVPPGNAGWRLTLNATGPGSAGPPWRRGLPP